LALSLNLRGRISLRNYNNPRVFLTREMHIRLNGEGRTFPPGTTLYGLVEALKLEPERVAIELDRLIVKRERWTATTISEGSEVEIVMFVGGG
jgi:sulfur carrier protein